MKNELISLYSALDTIEVKGNKNVKTMANCMSFLEQLIAKCDEPKQEEKKEEPTVEEQAE